MKKIINFFFVSIWLISYPLSAFSGAPPADEALLKNKDYTVVIATVDQALTKKSSRRHPPKLILQIDQVLRGDLKPGKTEVLWSAASGEEGFYAMRSGKEKYEEWLNESYNPPEVGTKWILLLDSKNEKKELWVNTRCRYPFSEEKLKWVKKEMKG